MNPPPPKEIFTKLLNTDLFSVSHGLYTVHLCFENDNRLSVAAPFRFAKKEFIADSPVYEFPLSDSQLVRVLGSHVREIACDTDGTLELLFSNGYLLTVYANSPKYEAYTLLIDGKEYIF